MTSELPTRAGPLLTNGINGATGGYFSPQQIGSAALSARDQSVDADLLRRIDQETSHLGVLGNPKELSQCGWAVVFPPGDCSAIREALSPLLSLRRRQAGEYYRELVWQPKQSKRDFLKPFFVGQGPADARRLPYYLLFIGAPSQLSYEFQYHLDIEYAVGRLHFEALADYDSYARAVVAAELLPAGAPRRVVMFGPDHDPATELSAWHLLDDLANQFKVAPADRYLAGQATKDRLGRLLGAEAPDLLLMACHGLGFPPDHPLVLRHQGALLCQDCPDPAKFTGPIPEAFYFSGDDVLSCPAKPGMIAFTFACFGAGTPEWNSFAEPPGGTRVRLAPEPLISELPRRLLAGGALAVIGHVDRVFSTSYLVQHNPPIPWNTVFADALQRLLDGQPVGAAMEPFGLQHAVLGNDLRIELEEAKYGKAVDPAYLAGLQLISTDARNYLVLGDPAVRLPGK